MISSAIDPTAVRLVAQYLDQLCQRIPPGQSNNCWLLLRITNPIITQGDNCVFFHVNVRPSSAFNPVIVSIPVSKCLYRIIVGMYGILVIHTLFLLCFLHPLLLCLHAMHAHGYVFVWCAYMPPVFLTIARYDWTQFVWVMHICLLL